MTIQQPTQSAIIDTHLQSLSAPSETVRQQAQEALLAIAAERMRRLTSRMLDDYSRVRWFEQTDDVLQNALLRLHRALAAVVPATPTDFFRLTAAQIRRELIDLSRHHFGPRGHGTNERGMPVTAESGAEALPVEQSTYSPDKLAAWTELHERIATLPPDQRDLFDLLWYQELTQEEASELLGIPLRTLKRQWQTVRRALVDAMGARFPT